ncbi:MAG: hypothetical protein AABY22_23200, partial [Nanoarchaeota archaeon]
MGRAHLDTAIAKLKKEIEKLESYKKRILNYVNNLKDKHLKKELTYYEYELKINEKLDGKTIQEWLDYYNAHIKKFEGYIKREEKKFKIKCALPIIALLVFIPLLIISFFYFDLASNNFIKDFSDLAEKSYNEITGFTTKNITDTTAQKPTSNSEDKKKVP